jgi:hypothetical protein
MFCEPAQQSTPNGLRSIRKVHRQISARVRRDDTIVVGKSLPRDEAYTDSPAPTKIGLTVLSQGVASRALGTSADAGFGGADSMRASTKDAALRKMEVEVGVESIMLGSGS